MVKGKVFYEIEGFPMYVITKDGEITCTIEREYCLILKERIDRAGYRTVKLSNGKKYGTQYLHRLLARTFIENPMRKEEVNHINGNKLDCRLENLEWVTRRENQLHAIQLGLSRSPCATKAQVINMCTGEKYRSIKEAALAVNINPKTLGHYLNGRLRNKTCLQKVA